MDYRTADLNTRLALAKAIDTPLGILEQLVDDDAREVRQAIALNPNASEKLLSKLGKAFPEEIVQNPVFGILALENPGSAFIYLAKARSTTTAPEALATLSQESTDLEILTAVCTNPSTPTYVLQDLVDNPPDLYAGPDEYDDGDRHQPIFSAIAQNRNAPAALLRTIFEKHETAEYGLSRNPNTPVDILEKISKRYGYSLQMALLENSALPAHIVGRFLIERDRRVQSAAQAHPNQPKNTRELIDFINESPNTSPESLDQLSADHRRDVRILVAKHPNTSLSTLGKLVKDTDSKIIYSVANHPNSDSKILEIAAAFFVHQYNISSNSNKSWILQDAARLGEHPQVTDSILQILMKGLPHFDITLAKKNIPAETLISIAKQPSSVDTYEALARNVAAPSAALAYIFMRLTEHDEKMHRSRNILQDIAQHPNLSELLFSRFLRMPELLGYVASNSNLTARMMNQLIETRDERALLSLAQNSQTPPDVLLRLLGENKNVRGRLARNENLPLALVETLAEDTEPWVRRAIAQRPSLPVDVLEKLSKDESAHVCACVAAHSATTAEMLERLIQHPDSDVKAPMVYHPNASQRILLTLAEEDSVEIRAGLARRKDLNEIVIQVLFRKTAVELLLEIAKAERDRVDSEKDFQDMGFSLTLTQGGKRLNLSASPYNEYDGRVRRGKPHEKQVMALIARHPNTPQTLRDRIQANYGIQAR